MRINSRIVPVFLSTLSLPALVLFVLAMPAAAMGKNARLDKASVECIGCHDSAVSPDDPAQICHEAGCEHKIGADYAEAAGRDRSLAPIDTLPAELKLVDGKMSCVTCHVPYSKENHETLSAQRAMMPEIPDPMLSVDNTGSGLCLLCHLK